MLFQGPGNVLFVFRRPRNVIVALQEPGSVVVALQRLSYECDGQLVCGESLDKGLWPLIYMYNVVA
jgi:hypothetical protein